MAERTSAADADAGERGERPARRGKNVRGLRTRRELLDAALACFSEYGYGRTRISDIVFRAGVSQGNFYRHFDSKDAIFLEVLRPGLDELAASTGRSRIGDGADRPTMVALATAYLTTYARNRHILRLMREAAGADDGFAAMWLEQRATFVDRTRRLLARLQRDGKLAAGDLDLLADVLGSAIEQTAYVHVGMPAEAPRPERIRELGEAVGSVWYGALPLPPPGDGPPTER